MLAFHPAILRFLSDESAVTAVDYSLVITLVSIAAIVIFDEIGKTLIVVEQAATASIASTTP
jgi:Flp pilus assembly pilin Flp